VRLKVTESIAEDIVLGGSFLGGGGGGDLHTGMQIARLAVELGDLYIVSLDELKQDDIVVTASLVGAPAAKEKYVRPAHMLRSAQLLINSLRVEIAGFISSENGGTSSTNGWIPASLLGIPVVDAPANGRAHPMGLMGSLGLHKLKDYISIQAAVGGSKEQGRYVELLVRGNLESADKLVREAAVQAGGLVAVTRNPVTVSYLREHAAIGALSKAMEIGRLMRDYSYDVVEMCSKIFEYLGGGKIIDKGVVTDVVIETRGGYDIGRIIIKSATNVYEVTVWNEYMTLEDDKGDRLATFPDLIVTLDIKTSKPKTSAEVRQGDELLLVAIPKDLIPLGSGVKDPYLLVQVEKVVGKRILEKL